VVQRTVALLLVTQIVLMLEITGASDRVTNRKFDELTVVFPLPVETALKL
jgi:hypothetical protein